MSKDYIDQENDKLPDGWQFAPLMQVSNVRTGKKDANHAEVNGKYRFYTCAYEHMMCNTKSFDGECLILPGNGANVGEVFYYNGEFEAYQRTYVIEEIKILPKYLFYHLSYGWESINADKQYGSATNYIRIGNFENYFVKFPHLPEQNHIVAEIEKQFSRLDEAVENLKRVKANLKRYKASVLKAAVEGKLTEEWRKKHPDVEPADKLLQRILAERRKKWEKAELDKIKAKGKEPKDDKWKKKYKEPPQVDESLLPALPKGWAWANFERLAEDIPHALKAGPFGSSLKKSFYVPHGYKIYGQEQVIHNDHTYGDYYIDDDRYESLKSCAVKPGDILISLVGTIGKVLVLPKDIKPGIINPRLVKFSLDRRLVDINYVIKYIQSPYVKYLFSIASHGGTMDILNLTILKGIPITITTSCRTKKDCGQI